MGRRNSYSLGKANFLSATNSIAATSASSTLVRVIWVFMAWAQIGSRLLITGPSGRVFIGILRMQLGIEFFKGTGTCRAVKACGGCADIHRQNFSDSIWRNYGSVEQNYLLPSLSTQWPSQLFYVGESAVAKCNRITAESKVFKDEHYLKSQDYFFFCFYTDTSEILWSCEFRQ